MALNERRNFWKQYQDDHTKLIIKVDMFSRVWVLKHERLINYSFKKLQNSNAAQRMSFCICHLKIKHAIGNKQPLVHIFL